MTSSKIKVLSVLLIYSMVLPEVFTQTLPASVTQRIDSIFKSWDNRNSPGCAIGIVRNDSLIYAKGFGTANLENGTSITPSTIFYMASVSKQFTGYAIVLLARQGKLV